MVFQLAQLAFWLTAAPDGHAKNFSIFLRQGNAYDMTPLYDVLSVWPCVGKSRHGGRLRAKHGAGKEIRTLERYLDQVSLCQLSRFGCCAGPFTLPVNYFGRLDNSFSSPSIRFCNAAIRVLSAPTFRNTTLSAGASSVLP